MPELVIWKKQQINRLRRDMARMLERMLGEFRPAPSSKAAWKQPSYDLIETEKDLVLRAEIPGIDLNELEIDITDNVLTIEGEIKQETINEDENYHRIERRHSSFSRSVLIPGRIMFSKVKGTYKNGVLKIVMPKYSGEEKRGVKVRLR